MGRDYCVTACYRVWYVAVQLLMIFVATHASGCSERGELNCNDTYTYVAFISVLGATANHGGSGSACKEVALY